MGNLVLTSMQTSPLSTTLTILQHFISIQHQSRDTCIHHSSSPIAITTSSYSPPPLTLFTLFSFCFLTFLSLFSCSYIHNRTEERHTIPRHISQLSRIKRVSCGREHTAIVTYILLFYLSLTPPPLYLSSSSLLYSPLFD